MNGTLDRKRHLMAIMSGLLVCTVVLAFCSSALASTAIPDNVYIEQAETLSCTLASATMMIRARAALSGYVNYGSITEASVGTDSVWTARGLAGSFTHNFDGNSVSVSQKVSGGLSFPEVKNLLDQHPEGIVLYYVGYNADRTFNWYKSHAVLATDYEGDTIYCADPGVNPGVRITLESSRLGQLAGNQSQILSVLYCYWYVSSYQITPSIGSEMKSGYNRTIADGDYLIVPTANVDFFMDIYGSDKPAKNGMKIGLWSVDRNNIMACDIWTVSYKNGFYTIKQKGTNMCLDVEENNGSKVKSGTKVQVWESTGSANQQWAISQNSDGYRLQARCSGYSLDIAGGSFANDTKIQQYYSNDSAAQRWSFLPYKNGKVTFPGSNTTPQPENKPVNHDPVGKLESCEGGAGTVHVSGWAKDEDRPNQSLSIHVYVGGPAGSGAPCYAIDAKRYRFDQGGNYGFDETINVSVTGTQQIYVYAINADDGNNPQIGTASASISSVGKEMTQGYSRTIADGDYLIVPTANVGFFMDIYGSDNPAKNGTKVGLWSVDRNNIMACDIWTVSFKNGFYTIKQKGTKMCLDVEENNGSRIKSGTKVQVWESTGSTNQQWAISQNGDGYRLQARCSGYSLDIAGGSFANDTKIQQYENNDSAAQRWSFLPYKNGKVTFPSTSSPSSTSVNFYFEDTNEMYYMSETTAQFGYIKISTNGNINDVKTSGCELADASGNILATHEEPSYIKNGGILHYFRINGDPNESDICYTLTPGTNYKFRSYVIYNGKKYYSNWRDFRTVDPPQSVAPEDVSFTFEDTDQMYFMSETTAQFGYFKVSANGNINDVKTSGCELADASGNILATHEEPSYIKNGIIIHYFRINGDPNESDICYTLTPGTNYKFRSYIIYNGEKKYSSWRDFKTKGDTPTPIPTSTPEPTAEPTLEPTEEPTPEPMQEVTIEPPVITEAPTEGPLEQQVYSAQLNASASDIGEDGSFVVLLSIAGNPGIGGITISSDFANYGISLVGAEASGIANSAQIAGASRISMISADEFSGDGEIARLTFNANGQENTTLRFDVDKATRADGSLVIINGASVSARRIAGSETNSSRTPGDANEDGIVDIVDAMIILRYDCGWDVSVNIGNSDVNADDIVDIVDAMIILRYDCGWDVELIYKDYKDTVESYNGIIEETQQGQLVADASNSSDTVDSSDNEFYEEDQNLEDQEPQNIYEQGSPEYWEFLAKYEGIPEGYLDATITSSTQSYTAGTPITVSVTINGGVPPFNIHWYVDETWSGSERKLDDYWRARDYRDSNGDYVSSSNISSFEINLPLQGNDIYVHVDIQDAEKRISNIEDITVRTQHEKALFYKYLDDRYDPDYPISFRKIRTIESNGKTDQQYIGAGYFDSYGNMLLDPELTGYSYVQGVCGRDMSPYSSVSKDVTSLISKIMKNDGTILNLNELESFEPIWMGDKYYYISGGSKKSGYSYTLYDENMDMISGKLSSIIPGYYIMSDESYCQKLYNTDGVLIQENLSGGSPWLNLTYDQYTNEAYCYEYGRSLKVYSLPEYKLIYQNNDIGASGPSSNGSIFTFREGNATGDGPHRVVAIKNQQIALDIKVNTSSLRASWYYPNVVEIKQKGYNEYKDTMRYFDLSTGQEQTESYAKAVYSINEHFDRDQFMKLANFRDDEWMANNIEGVKEFNDITEYRYTETLLDYNITSQILKAGGLPYIGVYNWEFESNDDYYFALFDPNTKKVIFEEESTRSITGPVAFLVSQQHTYYDSPILIAERTDGTFALINIANGACSEITEEGYKLVYLAKNHAVFAKYSSGNGREVINYRLFNANLDSWDLSPTEYYFKDSW